MYNTKLLNGWTNFDEIFCDWAPEWLRFTIRPGRWHCNWEIFIENFDMNMS